MTDFPFLISHLASVDAKKNVNFLTDVCHYLQRRCWSYPAPSFIPFILDVLSHIPSSCGSSSHSVTGASKLIPIVNVKLSENCKNKSFVLTIRKRILLKKVSFFYCSKHWNIIQFEFVSAVGIVLHCHTALGRKKKVCFVV